MYDARKTGIIDPELGKLIVDITALKEACLPSSGTLKEKAFIFFW